MSSAGRNESGADFSDVDSTTDLQNDTHFVEVIDEIITLQARYYQLGIKLGVPVGELNTLKTQYGGNNIDQAFNEMVQSWLKGRSTRTWQALVRAVDSRTGGNNHALALEIADRHRAANTGRKREDRDSEDEGTNSHKSKRIKLDKLSSASSEASNKGSARQKVQFSKTLPPHQLVTWLSQELKGKETTSEKLSVTSSQIQIGQWCGTSGLDSDNSAIYNFHIVISPSCGTSDLDGDILDDGSEDTIVHKGFAKTAHSDHTTLRVKFLNEIPQKWGHNWDPEKIIDVANRWRGKVAETYGKASECIPKFEENKEIGDIRVWFITDEDRKNGDTSRVHFVTGSLTERVSDQNQPTMWLDLGVGGDNYQTHVVVHEFGHALGLRHEHQRPDFWNVIKKYLKNDWVEKNPDYAPDATNMVSIKGKKYDPKSVMHFPLPKSWFKFESEKAIIKAGLPQEDRDILLGVFRIDHHNLPTEPSEDDVEYIMKMYKNPETTGPSPGHGPLSRHMNREETTGPIASPGHGPLSRHMNREETTGSIASPGHDPLSRHMNREDEKPEFHELQCLKGNGKEVRVIDNITSDWKKVARALKFSEVKIRQIAKKEEEEACIEMLRCWLAELKGCRTPISWKTLLSAIEEGTGEEGLAKEVRECF